MRSDGGAGSRGSPSRTACTRGESSHHSAMQRSVGSPPCSGLAGHAVLVRDVAAHNRAQPLDVEEGVLEFQRIEGPFDQRRCRAPGRPRAGAVSGGGRRRVAILGQHAQHVAVQVGPAAGLDAGDGEAEADHALAVVGAEDVAADLARPRPGSAAAAARYRRSPRWSSAARRRRRIRRGGRAAGSRSTSLRFLPQRLHFVDVSRLPGFLPCSASLRSM